MAKELAIITLHGMGNTKRNYANKLRVNLAKQLSDIWHNIHFESIYYQDTIQPQQDVVWEDMVVASPLRWQFLRRFMLHAFADAVALEFRSNQDTSAYKAVQKKIVQSLHRCNRALGNNKKPVIILAFSLGSQVISNYLWDSQTQPNVTGIKSCGIWEDDNPIEGYDCDEDFIRLKTCFRLITTGCNIPLFISGLNKIQAIQKPHPDFRWLNYYDVDDVLGWPLRPLSASYDSLVEDIPIDVGYPFASWNPLSHMGYWNSPRFLHFFTQEVRKVYETQH